MGSNEEHPIQIGIANEYKQDTSTEQDDNSHDLTVLHQGTQSENIVLLTGVARIWNMKRQQWQPGKILFDTGADHSFVSQNLTEDLGLGFIEVRNLEMYTFKRKEK
ncbi:unnamed protein product [Haemonchus placei]|uniref:Peptidase A2 domain-containing protein n=1 Tax=Haemonchus placei TaxID=6290 RepID=A0A0N4WBY0_HAEPC|nr:unnamed protein product [Haemonchus placei]